MDVTPFLPKIRPQSILATLGLLAVFGETEDKAIAAHRQLDAVRVLDQAAMVTMREGKGLLTGAQLFGQPTQETPIEIQGAGRKAPFFEYFYQIEGLKSGMHHQDGIFWVRTPQRQHYFAPEKVPLRAVAPTVLDLLGMEKPAFMKANPLLVQDTIAV